MSYPWYLSLENSSELLQGDLLPQCPIILPPPDIEKIEELEIEIETYNVVVMSQSCDLENNKVKFVLVCPYYSFPYYLTFLPIDEQKNKKSVKKAFDNLNQGIQPNYHLLNRDPEKGLEDFLVVDFRNVYSVHVDFLKGFAGKISERTRLLPPYREHLSQAFARFFMRVGLPQNIHQIDEMIYVKK